MGLFPARPHRTWAHPKQTQFPNDDASENMPSANASVVLREEEVAVQEQFGSQENEE